MEEFKAEQAARQGRFMAVLPFVLSFVGAVIMAWALSGVLFHLGHSDVRGGHDLRRADLVRLRPDDDGGQQRLRRPQAMLTLIDAGHWLGALLIMGAVLGWFAGGRAPLRVAENPPVSFLLFAKARRKRQARLPAIAHGCLPGGRGLFCQCLRDIAR